jgi:subtilisin-like proprotein convertase family protein
MENNYTVTYKVASRGANYVYQEDNEDKEINKGDVHYSSGGHMWYVLSDGSGDEKSYGFESKKGVPIGEGNVTDVDSAAYKNTSYEVTLALTAEQYNNLKKFGDDPLSFGFNKAIYHVLANSCVDFVYSSLEAIGYNDINFQGRLIPTSNIQPLYNLLNVFGAQIIRDDLTRNSLTREEIDTSSGKKKTTVYSDWYEEKDLQACLWLPPEERTSIREGGTSLIKVDINSSPQPQTSIQGENQAQQDAASGYIVNSSTHKVYTFDDLLNKTDFTSSQMASLATGGIRPGEVQLDPNARPNSWLSEFYKTPEGTDSYFSLLNAATLNGLSAMTTSNTYVDPLLLDLSGDGVHMTDIRDGVLFDMDHSGTLKRSGWTDRSTGILVIDDGSGQIKDVSQMFSEYYGGKAGTDGVAGETTFSDGFAALASEDSNRDGVIDRDDAIWSKLRVWVDGSHDAQVNAGELKTLDELGITQINVRAESKDEVRDGNRVVASGSFTINGKTQEALAVDFLGDLVSTTVSAGENGTRVTSTTDGMTTTAWASQSQNDETLDAEQLGVGNLYGGSGNDTLIASQAGSWLVGGAGSNTYVGGAGDDVFIISASDDTKNIHGNGGHDTAIIVGDQGVELNMAQAGLTLAEGGEGNDIIRSGGANGVFIKGGSGDSTLVGGMGDDVLVGGSGQNVIIGGSGKAVIYAGSQGDTIFASGGGSIIYAGGGDDKIFGGISDDVIEAGHGNATIDGDGGINLVTLHGNHGDYEITRTESGYTVIDRVAGRDGTLTLKNIQKLNFADISAVDLQLPNAMPVADVLTRDKDGRVFDHTQTHLISAESLLANDQRLNSQGTLRIANVGDACGGTVSLTAQGDILFTPDASYTGILSFKYGVVDAAGNLSATVVDLDSGQTAPMRAAVTLLTPEIPLDPLTAEQWYLSEANILQVWQDYTGKGVRIGQFEPGGQFATAPEIFDINHPDLVDNVDKAWLESQQASGDLPDLVSNHATMVAGVMVAAKNDRGGVGVAYDATLGGYYLANDGADLGGLGHMVSFDIANNSWGFTNDFALSNLQGGAVNTASSLSMNAQYAAANGRGGLGTVIVTAGGNERATGGNAQGSLTSNNRFSVQVGAINAQGDLSTLQNDSSPFSNPGASLLVSAPGSNIVSTSHMLETERGSTFGNDYSSMQGTSFATPIVSGVVALMLEANPNLGYRDVQQILALSAHKINDPLTDWSDNSSHSWNGGGMHTSNDYGFGEIDARAAVRLSEAWMTQSTAANEYVYSASSGPLGTHVAAGETLTSALAMNAGLNVEHVEIDFDAQVGRLGDLTVKLISPDGTQSILLNRQGKIPEGTSGASETDRGSTQSGSFKYTFMTTHDFGESSAGDWTLQITDATSGLPVTLNAWALRLYGSKSSPDDTYFYTDEYLDSALNQASRAVLDDAVNGVAGGRNTLNAAAVTRDTTVNLLSGVASMGGAALTIKNPSAIQNIVCGDGNDILVAGNEDALLDGGRGNNTLTGGAGKDFFVIHRRDAGSDVITNFSSARGEIIDLVGFSGKTFADLLLTQQGNDVSVELGNGQSLVLQNQQVAGIGAQNFTFQDTFVAPASYTSSDASTHQTSEGLGTVVLNGGGKGVLLSSDSQGNLTFSLNGTLYSHDRATSDRFVVTAQQGVTDYHNALRGFRHGIDKIDLRQTGITEFSQLSITQSNRGTINGLSQIHGVNVILNGVNEGDASVNLLYLDALETSQVSASDFIFAEYSPDLVPAVDTGIPSSPDQSVVTLPDTSTVPPLITDKPIEIPTFEPIVIKPIEIPAFEPIVIKPIEIPVFEPIEIKPLEPIIIKPIDLGPFIPLNPEPPSSSAGSQQADPEVVITVNKLGAKVVLGDESNIINVTSTFASVIAGNGNNKVNVTGRNANITVGNGDNNIAGSISKLTVGDGNNIVEDAANLSKIKLGEGNNQVVISGNLSTVEVGHGVNTLAFSGSMGHLIFGSDISPDRLWFRHQNQDLQISVIGSQQEVIVQNWYASSSERPRDITAGEHATLLYSNVENLVQAMAAFAPPVSATAMLADAELQRLQPVLAANWR